MAAGEARLGFRIEQVRLTSDSLRAGGPPLRFAQVSDLHLRMVRRRHDRLVEAVNERQLDFLCLTGDTVSRERLWPALEGLIGRFACRHGIFACPGNWEARCKVRPAVLKEAMAGWGVELLVNESRVVETDSGPVRIAGVDDLALGWPDFEAALANGTPAAYTILLSHAPLAARFLARDAGVNLVLSGHTHGGQIRIPLLWRWVLPSCHGGFTAGLYPMYWGHLYVNRGFGGAEWLPIRFRCPAEVTFFEVRPAETV